MLRNIKFNTAFIFFLLVSFNFKIKPAFSTDLNFKVEEEIISLNDFDYEVDPQSLSAISQRIDCKKLSKIVALPRSGSLSQTIQRLKNSTSPYDLLLEEIFNDDITDKACIKNNKKLSNISAVEDLYLTLKNQGLGLTILVVGGFGSHLSEEGSFFESRQRWLEYFGEKNDFFRIVRHECTPNSYASDEFCVPGLLQKFTDLESNSAIPHRYLILGYSKGGNTALDALAKSQALRDKSLALLTFGSPIGGGVAAKLVGPLLDQLSDDHLDNLNQFDLAVWSSLLSFGANLSQYDREAVQFKDLLRPIEFSILKNGFRSLYAKNRINYLSNFLSKTDFSKSKKDEITQTIKFPIFHIASITDIAKLKAFPRWDTDGQKTFLDLSEINYYHSIELGFIHGFSQHPLNDTCVALEHAVIPKKFLPNNLDSKLLVLLKVDHMSIATGSRNSEVPAVELIDGIIAAANNQLIKNGIK